MVDREQIIEELNLTRFSPEEQDEIYENFTYELGAAISDGLSEAQMDEFTQIINGNDEVIAAWLAANRPTYTDDPVYKGFQVGYEEDSDKVPAAKVYASIAWVRENRPDFDQIVMRVKREFRQALDAQAAA